jgi:hypothetical protein
MVSFHLLNQGLRYFAASLLNFLPLLQYSTNLFYLQQYLRAPCRRVAFTRFCLDWTGLGGIRAGSSATTSSSAPGDGSNLGHWNLGTDVGAVSQYLAIAALILLGVHTIQAMAYLAWQAQRDAPVWGFLGAVEPGCCGVGALLFSCLSEDDDDPAGVTRLQAQGDGPPPKMIGAPCRCQVFAEAWRKYGGMLVTLLHAFMVVACCLGISMTWQRDDHASATAFDAELYRGMILVLLPCLLANVSALLSVGTQVMVPWSLAHPWHDML